MSIEKIEKLIEQLRADLSKEMREETSERLRPLSDLPSRLAIIEVEYRAKQREKWLRRIGEWWLLSALVVVGSTVGYLSPSWTEQFKQQIVMEVSQFTPQVMYPTPAKLDALIERHMLELSPEQAALRKLNIEHQPAKSNRPHPVGSPDAIFRTGAVLPAVPD